MSGTPSAADGGATAVEYALMLALIFAVIITGVGLLGVNLAAAFAGAAALI